MEDRKSKHEAPICALCAVLACDAEPGIKQQPKFCAMSAEPELLQQVEAIYTESGKIRDLAIASARTEASGYMRRTRVEDVMDFARRIGARRLGIAHCIGLMHEAKVAMEIFIANGFEVYTACCKVGSIPKEQVGLADEEKVTPGQFEPICNPVAQAALLEKAGTQLNVVVGLCVGHDSLFFMHSHAPTTVLVAKDRVLAHNPVAALYTSNSYYRRLKDGESADDYLRRQMGDSDEEFQSN
jgi:uncharacterized metal-binding protein